MSARPRPVRRSTDHSQRLRLGFQLAFVLLNVWIGAQFYLWVRAFERGASPAVPRPAGVDGWLPIAALMNLKAWIVTGTLGPIHPAGTLLLVAFLAMSLLAKKAFCSWLCPVGTLSEWLWKLGRRMFGRTFAAPRWLDVPLRGLKYLLLGFFGWAVVNMPADAIAEFMYAPYGVIADVKLLNFFRFIGTTGIAVLAILVLLSLVVQNVWCRYLCPYGALLGLVALVSPTRIRRNAETCIDCAKCTKACPARLNVGTLPQIRSAECTLCMTCVAVCPVKGALDAKITSSRAVPAWAIAAAIAAIFLGITLAGRITGHWQTAVPDEYYRAVITASDSVGHP